MSNPNELSVADFFAFGNAAAAHSAELRRQAVEQADKGEPDERNED